MFKCIVWSTTVRPTAPKGEKIFKLNFSNRLLYATNFRDAWGAQVELMGAQAGLKIFRMQAAVEH
jgi:hypothetical protein